MLKTGAVREKVEKEKQIFGITEEQQHSNLEEILADAQKYRSTFFSSSGDGVRKIKLMSYKKKDDTNILYTQIANRVLRWSPTINLFIPIRVENCVGMLKEAKEIEITSNIDVIQKLCSFVTVLNTAPITSYTGSDAENLKNFLSRGLEYNLTSDIISFIEENSNNQNTFLKRYENRKLSLPTESSTPLFKNDDFPPLSNNKPNNNLQPEVSPSSPTRPDRSTTLPPKPTSPEPMKFARESQIQLDHLSRVKLEKLHHSIQECDYDTVEKMLSRPDQILQLGATPNSTYIADSLTVNNLVNGMNTHGWTSLHVAAMMNDERLCSLLLDFGADVSLSGFEGLTPLHYFIKANSYQFLTLQSTMDDIAESSDNSKKSPAPKKGNQMTSLTNLLANLSPDRQQNSSPSLGNSTGNASILETTSSMTSYYRSLRVLSGMLAKGLKIDSKNSQGETPLHYACKGRCYYIAKFLIMNGANINDITKANHTPLHFAMFSTEELVEEYSALYSMINSGNTNGGSPSSMSHKKSNNNFNTKKPLRIKANKDQQQHLLAFSGENDSYFLMLDLLAFMLEHGALTHLKGVQDSVSNAELLKNNAVDQKKMLHSRSSSTFIDKTIDESFDEWVSRQPPHVKEVLQKALETNYEMTNNNKRQRRSMMIKRSVIESLNQTNDLSNEQMKRDLRDAKLVLIEIIEKEQSYITYLTNLKERYMDVVGEFISKDAHNTIFKHLVVILNLHQQLMQQLPPQSSIETLTSKKNDVNNIDSVMSDGLFSSLLTVVVNAYSSFLPHFKIYCEYVNNMHYAMQLVVDIKNNNERFASHCKEMVRKSNSRLDISDLLIMPFQKITRYSILFERLAKSCPLDIANNIVVAMPLKHGTVKAESSNNNSNNNNIRSSNTTSQASLMKNPLTRYCEDLSVLVGQINTAKMESEARQKVLEIATMIATTSSVTTTNPALLMPELSGNNNNGGSDQDSLTRKRGVMISKEYLVQAHRIFMHEGKISKYAEDGVTVFNCYLFNDIIVFSTTVGDNNRGSGNFSSFFRTKAPSDTYLFGLADIQLFDVPDLEETLIDHNTGQPLLTLTNCFQLVALEVVPGKDNAHSKILENWTLSAPTEKDKKFWMDTIKNAQHELTKKVRTFSKN